MQSAVRGYIKPFTAEMHTERASWANCLPLYFYICIDIYDMKQMEGSAERAVHLFYLSVSVNPLLTFLQAVRVQGPSLLMQGHSGLPHTAISISDICHALISAIPAACPFLQQRDKDSSL